MHVFNVPSSAPFLHTVIAALVDGRLIAGFDARKNRERLADVTLYLPTQRAGRMARDIFLEVLDTDAVILPRIVALGDADEDELAFAQIENSGLAAFDLPPALEGLQRTLVLAQLVTKWAHQLKPGDGVAAPLIATGPASILALANDLARLMDDMVTRGVAWRALDGLVPADLDKYWQLTLDFLKIAKDIWPALLAEQDRIEPAARRDRLIAAEAARLTAHQKGPVIAAGSTGSMPSTAGFLHAIAKLPQGAVVLPGLDHHLDESSWQSIADASSHPQFALHRLLTEEFKITRADIIALAQPSPHGREVLVSEAMRPATSSAQWHARLCDDTIAQQISAGTSKLTVIEAANPEMEALAIAVAMREAHEQNFSTALVTPDRTLARRVMAALGRWNLAFDDSGGDGLMETPAGIFARLTAQTVADQLAPATLLALLKHPLFRLGGARGAHADTIADLEIALLRGTRPLPGSAGLIQDFAGFRDELARLKRGEASSLHASEPRTKLDDFKAQCGAGADCAICENLEALRGDEHRQA